MKTPLLLLPGLLCDEALWKHQIDALGDIADCRVADITKHDRVEALARDVLTDAPSKFALAGLSMGGYVALEIMRQAPERVLKLCLLDTSARADTPQQKERRTLFLAMAKKGQFRGVTPRLLPMLIHPDHLDNDEITGTIMDMAERVGREAFHNQQTAILNRIDSRPFLKDIHCPVQLICGAQDALTPTEVVSEMGEHIPHARFCVIGNCGHLSTLEKPDDVNRIMRRWLEEGGP